MAETERQNAVNDLLDKKVEENLKKQIGYNTLGKDYDALVKKIQSHQKNVNSGAYISPEAFSTLEKEIADMQKRMSAYGNWIISNAPNSKEGSSAFGAVDSLTQMGNALKGQSSLYADYDENSWKEYYTTRNENAKKYSDTINYDEKSGQANVDALKNAWDEANKEYLAIEEAYYKMSYATTAAEQQKWEKIYNDLHKREKELLKKVNNAADAYNDAKAKHDATVTLKNYYLTEDKYNNLDQKADWAEKSAGVDTSLWDFGKGALAADAINNTGKDNLLDVYDAILNNRGAIAGVTSITAPIVSAVLPFLSTQGRDERDRYEHLTDEQRKKFNYLYNTEGEKAAMQYLDNIDIVIAGKEAQEEKAKSDKFVNSLAEWVPGNWAEEVVEVPVYAVQGFKSGAEEALPNLYSGLFNKEKPIANSEYLLQSLSEDSNPVSKALLETGQSIGNMTPSIIIGTALQAIGVPTGLASAIGAAEMGFQARGSAYSDAIRAGYDKDKASLYATVNGALEATLQYALGGIGGVSSKAVSKGITAALPGLVNGIAKIQTGWLRVLASGAFSAVKNMGSEALEEGLQAFLDPYVRQLILEDGDLSKVNVDWEEIGYSALLGALTSGIMGPMEIISDIQLPEVTAEYISNQYDTSEGEDRFSVILENLSAETSALLKQATDAVSQNKPKEAQKLVNYAKNLTTYTQRYIEREGGNGAVLKGTSGQYDAINARIKDGTFNSEAAATVLRENTSIWQTVAEKTDNVAHTLLNKSLSNKTIEDTVLKDKSLYDTFKDLTGVDLNRYKTLSEKRNAVKLAAESYKTFSESEAAKTAQAYLEANTTEKNGATRTENRIKAMSVLNDEVSKLKAEATNLRNTKPDGYKQEVQKLDSLIRMIINTVTNIRNHNNMALASRDGSVVINNTSKATKEKSATSENTESVNVISVTPAENDLQTAWENLSDEMRDMYDIVGEKGTTVNGETKILTEQDVNELNREAIGRAIANKKEQITNLSKEINKTKSASERETLIKERGEARQELKALEAQRDALEEYIGIKGLADKEKAESVRGVAETIIQERLAALNKYLGKYGVDIAYEMGGTWYVDTDGNLLSEDAATEAIKKGKTVFKRTNNGEATDWTVKIMSALAEGSVPVFTNGNLRYLKVGTQISAEQAVDIIIGHELVHFVKNNASKQSQDLYKKIINNIKGTSYDVYEIGNRMAGLDVSEAADRKWNALKNLYADAIVNNSDGKVSKAKAMAMVDEDYIYEEIAANYMGSLMASEGVIDTITETLPTMQKIMMSFSIKKKKDGLKREAARVDKLANALLEASNRVHGREQDLTMKRAEMRLGKANETVERMTQKVQEAEENLKTAEDELKKNNTAYYRDRVEKAKDNLLEAQENEALAKEEAQKAKTQEENAKKLLSAETKTTGTETKGSKMSVTEGRGYDGYIPPTESIRFNVGVVDAHKESLANKITSDSSVGLDTLMARYDKILEIWDRLGGELNSEFLNEWNSKTKQDRVFTVFKAQTGYKYNIELSSMCKKGVPLFEAIDEIVRKEIMKDLGIKTLGKAEKELLYDILSNKGFDIPCAICYVEQARQREGDIINAFLDGNNDGKLGWNQVLENIEKEMANNGVEYSFKVVGRDIATDVYTPESIVMDGATQDAFYSAWQKLANEEITRYNEETKAKKLKRNIRPLIKEITPNSIKNSLGGSAPANFKIFKVLYEEQNSRMKLEHDLLQSSMSTANLKGRHSRLYSLFNQQGGASGFKTKQTPVIYAGDILEKRWKASDLRISGGARNQSNSDSQMYTLIDQVQMYIDFTARGYYMQAYTKVLSEIKLFGLSNSKINASLIPKVKVYYLPDGKTVDVARTMETAGLDENGEPLYDDIEGINHDEAFMLIEDPEYSKSVGGVCIGYSDKHIFRLLDDPRIQLIIGFHDKTDDPDARYRGAKYSKNYNGENEAVKHNPDGTTETVYIGFNQFVLKAEKMFSFDKQTETYSGTTTFNGKTYTANDIPRLAADLYLDMCAKKNYTPAYNTFKGHKNYYKLLADFSLYDSEGNYAPQKKVAYNMPDKVPYLENGKKKYTDSEKYIKKELEKELSVRADVSEALADTSEDGIIPQFVAAVKEMQGKKSGSKMSVTEATDSVSTEETSAAELVSHIRNIIKERKAKDPNASWREGDVFDYVESHPDLNFVDRIYNKDKTAKKDLEAFLGEITDTKTLEDFKWFVGQAYNGKDADYWSGTYPYRGASRTFQNAVNKRINEIVSEKVGGTDLGVTNGEVSLDTIKGMFDRLNTNEEIVDLAKRAFATADKLGVNIRFANQVLSSSAKVSGDAWGDMVEYKTSVFNDKAVTDQFKANTILHEIIHTCTNYYLFEKPNDAISRQLKDIYTVIRNDPNFAGQYGLKDAHEMIAELSNEKFVARLKKKNLWDSIIDAIARIFGYSRGTTAYDNVSQILDYLLDNPDVDTYKKHAVKIRKAANASNKKAFGKTYYTDYYGDQRVMYSVSAEEDEAYMDAYFDGDDDAMQEMVDEAARKAGYRYKAYHRTENAFTKFDLEKARKSMDIQGFYFSADPYAEEEYGSVRYDTYLKMNNPYIVDSKESQKALPFDLSKGNAGVTAREWLIENGYDGVIRKAEYFGAAADEYMVLYPNQIKSAEPMVFADDEYGEGDIIPLSERFNPENDDIRYSVSETVETDSRGKRLTTEQVEFFKDSQIRVSEVDGWKNTITANGALFPVYHGTYSDEFFEFDNDTIGSANDYGWYGKGFYFAFTKEEASFYGDRVLECYLNVKKPFFFSEEMRRYDGQKRGDANYDFAAFVLNLSDKFPDIAQKTFIEVTNKGEYGDITKKTFTELAQEIKAIYESNRLQMVEVADQGEMTYQYVYSRDLDSLEAPEKIKKLIKEHYIDSTWKADWEKEHGTISSEEYDEIIDLLERYDQDELSDRWIPGKFDSKGFAEENRLSAVISYLRDYKYGYFGQHMPEYFMENFVGDSFAEELRKRGYDGVLQSRFGDEVVVFDSNQIKLTSNKNPTSDPDMRYSVSEVDETIKAPVFYSKMGKVIDGIKQNKMGAKDVLNYLTDPKRGVKAEEIKWSGIETFLEGKKSVTKEELQEFVAGSMLEIEEIELKAIEPTMKKLGKHLYKISRNIKGVKDVWLVYDIWMKKWLDSARQVYWKTPEEALKRYRESSVGSQTKWSEYKLEGGKNYRELVFKMPNSSYTNTAMQAHWEDEGVLAHTRVQDFETTDGKKMLFVEEIQSDWHNAGAKHGYVDKSKKHSYEVQIETQPLTGKRVVRLYRDGEATPHFNYTEDAEIYDSVIDDWREKTEDEYLEGLMEVEKAGLEEVPDAPFSNNYHEYVLKRLLRMAAEEGYDSIGWTTADLQMQRWNPDRSTNKDMGMTDAKNPDAVAFEDGYRIEYDQDIPKFLNKYGKKWGAKVGKAEIEAAEHTEGGALYDAENVEVWSMDITDSMKDSVLYEGQEMYSVTEEVVGGENYAALAESLEKNKANTEKLINAMIKNGKGEYDVKSIPQFIRDVRRAYGSKDSTGVNNAYSDAYQYVYNKKLRTIENGKSVWKKVDKVDPETAREMFRNVAKVIFDSSVEDDRASLLREIRKIKISVPNEVKMTFENWNKFRMSNFGRLSLVKDGVTIGEAYAKLNEIAPELFPDSITDPVEQLNTISNEATNLRNEIESEEYTTAEMDTIEAITAELIGGTMALDPSAKHLYETLAETRQYYRERIENIKASKDAWWQDVMGEKLRNKDERYRLHYEKGINQKLVKDLTTRLYKPTTDKHIPESMRGDIAYILGGLKLPDKPKAYKELKSIIKNVVANGEFDEATFDKFPEGFEKTVNEVHQVDFENMDSVTAHELNQFLRSVMHYINLEDSLFHSSESASYAAALATEQINLSTKNNKIVNGFVQKVDDLWMSAYDAEGLFNYVGVDELYRAYQEIAKGQDAFASSISKYTDLMSKVLKENGLNEGVPKEWHTKKIAFSLDGSKKPLLLTQAELMSLYLLEKQEDSRNRLLNIGGGIETLKQGDKEVEETVNGKTKKVTRKGYVVAGSFKLTKDDLYNKILPKLDTKAKGVADGISKILNGEIANDLNQTSLVVDGYKKFNVKNYFPESVSDTVKKVGLLDKEIEALMTGKSFTKDRTGSKGVPLKINDIFEVYDRHILGASQYIGYEKALRDFNKIYNGTYNGKRLSNVIQNKMGVKTTNAIENFIRSVQGRQMNTRDDQQLPLEKMFGNYKAAKVMLNASVVMKQPTALLRAVPEFSGKGVDVIARVGKESLKAMGDAVTLRRGWDKRQAIIDEMVEHSGLARMKSWGFSEYATAKTVGQLYDKNSLKLRDKANEVFPFNLAERADLYTWSIIWEACKAETNTLEEATDKFNDVIRKTQVVESATTSSPIVKSNFYTKIVFAFKNEPLKTLNYVRACLKDVVRGKEGAGNHLAKALVWTGLSIALTSAITTAFSLGRDDEDDDILGNKDWWKVIGDTFSENFWSDVFGTATVFLGDIIPAVESALRGREVERADTALVTDTVNLLMRLYKGNYAAPIFGKDSAKKTGLSLFYDASDVVSTITGLPIRTVMRDTKAIAKNTLALFDDPNADYFYDKQFYTVKGNKARYKEILTEALDRSYEDYAYIKNDLVKRGYTQTDIDNAVKSSDRFVTAWNDSPEAFRKELNEAQKIDKMFSSDYVIKMMDKRRSDIAGDLFELMMKGEKITAAEKKTAAEKREEILNFRDPKTKRLTTEKTLNELLEDKAMSKMRSDVNNIVLTSDLDIDKKLEEIFKRYEKFGVKLSDVKKVAREKDKL